LYSSSGLRPNATLVNEFFPKYILRRDHLITLRGPYRAASLQNAPALSPVPSNVGKVTLAQVIIGEDPDVIVLIDITSDGLNELGFLVLSVGLGLGLFHLYNQT
jgi:hypothetical protein